MISKVNKIYNINKNKSNHKNHYNRKESITDGFQELLDKASDKLKGEDDMRLGNLKQIYVLHQSHEVVGGSVSAVFKAFETRDEAVLENAKNHRGYYEVDGIWIKEKSLNKIQRFANKIFKIR